MKLQKLFLALFALVLFMTPAEAAMKLESSEHWVRVEFDALPQSAAEVSPCQTPEETAALAVAALVRYTENQEAGIAMLNALRGPRPLSPQEIQLLKDQLLGERDYVARSHFNGATPDNDYTPIVPYASPSPTASTATTRKTTPRSTSGAAARTAPARSRCAKSPRQANGSCGTTSASCRASASPRQKTRGGDGTITREKLPLSASLTSPSKRGTMTSLPL